LRGTVVIGRGEKLSYSAA